MFCCQESPGKHLNNCIHSQTCIEQIQSTMPWPPPTATATVHTHTHTHLTYSDLWGTTIVLPTFPLLLLYSIYCVPKLHRLCTCFSLWGTKSTKDRVVGYLCLHCSSLCSVPHKYIYTHPHTRTRLFIQQLLYPSCPCLFSSCIPQFHVVSVFPAPGFPQTSWTRSVWELGIYSLAGLLGLAQRDSP